MHWTNAWYTALWPQYLNSLHLGRQGVEVGLAHWITTTDDHFVEFLLPDHTSLDSTGLEDIMPNGIVKGRQQGEASPVYTARVLLNRIYSSFSHTSGTTGQEGSDHIVGRDPKCHKEGSCNTMWEDRSLSRTGSISCCFHVYWWV